MFLRHITPPTIEKKLIIASGNIPDIIESGTTTYTTIITNSVDDINRMVDEPKRYRVQSTLFLLRNHSENMTVIKNPETGKLDFIEDRMDELLPKIMDMKTGFPKSRIRFGRFEPQLFIDMEKRFTGFKNF